MNMSTHKTQPEYFILESGGHTHTSETVNPTSHTRQRMHSQVKRHFQQIRKGQLIKLNPNRQNTCTRTSLFRPVLSHK